MPVSFLDSFASCGVALKYNRIRILLAERDRTASWLAEQLDINRTITARWCRNDAQPRIPVLYDIAEVLEVEVAELLVKERPRPPELKD